MPLPSWCLHWPVLSDSPNASQSESPKPTPLPAVFSANPTDTISQATQTAFLGVLPSGPTPRGQCSFPTAAPVVWGPRRGATRCCYWRFQRILHAVDVGARPCLWLSTAAAASALQWESCHWLTCVHAHTCADRREHSLPCVVAAHGMRAAFSALEQYSFLVVLMTT